MTDYISGLAALMRAEVDTLNTIAQNAANVNTVGYKAERSSVDGNFVTSILQPINIEKSVDKSFGELKVTTRNFDFAIMGEGWFVVKDLNGAIRLTRDGQFHVNAEGILVNASNFPVMGSNGEIANVNSSLTVSQSGIITQEGNEIEKFALVKPSQAAKLTPAGNGLYEIVGTYEESENHKVIQGALEMSNVDVAADMVRLMETTRHIESIQRAITSYDQLLNVGINQLGK